VYVCMRVCLLCRGCMYFVYVESLCGVCVCGNGVCVCVWTVCF